ncbi:MAG: hypothetical protein BGO69_19095 [Bacteroidetes bacterium 46-16]|nr:MAG: hypothetical protein BGO69_19095 [Bacteroidetes bacterium 46-16]
MKVLVWLGTLLLTVYANETFAQKRSDNFYFPKAVLVQLRSEQRKVDYLQKHGSKKDLERLREDVQGVNAAMVNDFKDHFKLCPVYFFVDTNADLIKAKKFGGILFDTDMKPVNDPVVNAGSKDYYIIFYGLPEREDLHNDNDLEAARTSFGEGLVLNDYNYRQLKRPIRFYYYRNRGYYGIAKRHSIYNYSSKKYNIEYYELAGEVSAGTREFFR